MASRLLFAALLLFSADQARPQDKSLVQPHNGWVGAVVFARDGQTLYSGAGDGQLFAWSLGKNKQGVRFAGHRDAVTALALSTDGKTLASASFDGTAKLWEPATGKLRHTLKAHRGAVMSTALTHDGGQLVTGGMDGTVFLWEVSTGKQLGSITRHRSWVNALAVAPDGTLASGSSDNTVRFFKKNDKEWKLTATKEFSEGEVRSLAFTPDGKKLAVGVRYGILEVWDMTREAAKLWRLPGHAADVWAVAFSPDGQTLASGDGDWDRPGQVFLWDMKTGKKKGTLNASNEVLSLAFAPDGNRLAAGAWDKTARIWSLKR